MASPAGCRTPGSDVLRPVLMDSKKFLITLWADEYDSDGLTNEFAVLGEFHDLAQAELHLEGLTARMLREGLVVHSSWHAMDITGKESPGFYIVNRNNKVLKCRSFKIGDGTGFNSRYTYLELIELPGDAVVDEKLFDLKNCAWEVRAWFNNPRRE